MMTLQELHQDLDIELTHSQKLENIIMELILQLPKELRYMQQVTELLLGQTIDRRGMEII